VVAVQSDDKIVAIGSTNSQPVVARYTAAGILDTTYNGTGYAIEPLSSGSTVHGYAIQSDGKILVVGSSTEADSNGDLWVARYLSTGAFDTSFGGGKGYVLFDIDGSATPTNESGSALALQPDGKIIAVGREIVPGSGIYNALVVRFNPDGTLDTSFGTSGYKLVTAPSGHSFVAVNAVALKANGNIIVAGQDRPIPGSTTEYPLLMQFLP
jgi:uncharacterized delta-60 repeat protein